MKLLHHGLFLVLAVCNRGLADDQIPSPEEIIATWNGNLSAISTAKIEFQRTRLSHDEPSISKAETLVRISEIPLDPEKFIPRLVEALHPKYFNLYRSDQRPKNWAPWDTAFYIDNGQSIRSVDPQTEHIIDRDIQLFVDRPNSHIHAYDIGEFQFGFENLDWFTAATSLARDTFDHVEEITQTSDAIILKFPQGGTTVLDRESFHVVEATAMASPEASIIAMEIFRAPTIFPGDIELPAIRVSLLFKDDLLKTFTATAITDAKFNQPIEQQEFVLKGESGETAFDHRGGKVRSYPWKREIADVVEFFLVKTPLTQRPPGPPPEKPSFLNWKAFFLIANGIMLIVIGLILWKRHG